ncbi:MAG: PilT/PilU family type 4a pilus ATPase [Verrucomicrobiae bacterium]|nr:PilT/PilU family type 4a pilus ATPase [Verrucomicrobiae bacterium]
MEYLSSLLRFATNMGASDVHIKANRHATLRIARDLFTVEVDPPSEEDVQKVVDVIMPEHLKSRFQREKEVDFSYFHEGIGRFRVNVFQQRGHISIAMRFVKTQIPSFEELHLPEVLRKIATTPRGIVLLAGSTGSGKSTTLAAMVEQINNTAKKHIVTLEDPIEYLFEEKQCVIDQREIGLDTLSFDRALSHVLRQDPDIIMIGEMRDSQSFMAALSAADTGHLVLSTVHTTNSSQALGRILDFFPAHDRDQIRRQLAVLLQAVVCQRLIPAIGGGVVPAIEIMLSTPIVRKLIEENKLEKLPAAIETGADDGMQTFNQSIYKLIKAKLITEADGLERASNPDALRMNLKGIFLDEGRRIMSAA